MSRDYPEPSYAASIWIKGDQIWLGFNGHSTPFPATPKGMELAVATLRERTKGKILLGENGAPSWYQVERILKHDRRWNEMLQIMRGSIERTERQRHVDEAEMDELLKDML